MMIEEEKNTLTHAHNTKKQLSVCLVSKISHRFSHAHFRSFKCKWHSVFHSIVVLVVQSPGGSLGKGSVLAFFELFFQLDILNP